MKLKLMFLLGFVSIIHTHGQNLTNYTVDNTDETLQNTTVQIIAVDSLNGKWIATSNSLFYYDNKNVTQIIPGNKEYCIDIKSIAIDKDNNKWIMTQTCLTKFDGTKWINYNTLGYYNELIAIAIDHSGNIWAAANNGLHKFDGKSWQSYSYSGYISAIAIDNKNNVWVGCDYRDGLAKFDGNTWTRYPIAGNSIEHILIDAQDHIIISHDNAVTVYSEDMSTRILFNDSTLSNNSNRITTLAKDSLGNLLIATTNEGINMITPSNKLFHNVQTNLFSQNTISNAVYSIVMDRSGNKWIGDNNGILYDNHGKYTNILTHIGLYCNQVNYCSFDKNNIGWFGTNQGLTSYDVRNRGYCTECDLWQYHNTSEGLSNNWVNCVTIDSVNNKWIGTKGGGVSFYDNKNWLTYNDTNGLANDSVNCIAIDNQNNAWIGTNSGVSHYSNSKWETFNTSNGLMNNKVLSVAIDHHGNKWFGTDGGVSEFDGSNWINYTTRNGLVNNKVNAIFIDAKNVKWFGTAQGVSKFDDIHWTSVNINNGFNDNMISCITVDSKGFLWFGTQHGVAIFDGSNWAKIDTSNGMNSNGVSSISIDALGQTWISTYKGTTKLSNVFYNISPTSFTLKAEANNSVKIQIFSESNWSVSNDQPAWLHVKPMKGINIGFVIVSADANPYLIPRTARLLVSIPGNAAQTITISQMASNKDTISIHSMIVGDTISKDIFYQHVNKVLYDPVDGMTDEIVAYSIDLDKDGKLDLNFGINNDMRHGNAASFVSGENFYSKIIIDYRALYDSSEIKVYYYPFAFNKGDILVDSFLNTQLDSYFYYESENLYGSTLLIPWTADTLEHFIGFTWMRNGKPILGWVRIKNVDSRDYTIIDYAIQKVAVPDKPDKPTGSQSVCNSVTSQYDVNSNVMGDKYIFALQPTSAGTISNLSTTKVSVKWNTSFAGEAFLKVQATNYSGISEFSDSLSIQVHQTPAQSEHIFGNQNACRNKNNLLYYSNVLAGATSYIWDLPAGVTGSSTSDSIYLSFVPSYNIGTIQVKGHNDFCDGPITTLSIIVNKTIKVAQNKIICGGNYLSHTESGIYTDTLLSYLGCDSIVTTYLKVNPVYNITENKMMCGGSYKGHSVSGTYIENRKSIRGCDSIVTINLQINPTYNIIENKVICMGSYKGHDTSGTYIENLRTYLGCDSIVTTNLEVISGYNIAQNKIICGGNYNGHTVSGIYTESLKSYQGCDSIVTTNLKINPVYNIAQNKVICGGSYNGHSKSGSYIDNLKTFQGCDSIVATHLTIEPVTPVIKYVSICGGSYQGHSESETFTENLKSYLGCDSIVTTHLKVNPEYNIAESKVICGGSYKGHMASGTYIENLKTYLGCDSSITTYLTVNAIPATPKISLVANVLQSDASNGNQWYFDNIFIQDAVNSSYAPTQTGNYNVIVTLNNCASGPSNTISYVPLNVEDNTVANGIDVSPNPTSSIINIVLHHPFTSSFTVELIDNGGHLISKLMKDKSVVDFTLDMSHVAEGVYVLHLFNLTQDFKMKIVKRLK